MCNHVVTGPQVLEYLELRLRPINHKPKSCYKSLSQRYLSGMHEEDLNELLANYISTKVFLSLDATTPTKPILGQRNKKTLDGLRVFGGRPVMTDSVVVRGSTDGEAKSFHLKHSLTVRVANHRIA